MEQDYFPGLDKHEGIQVIKEGGIKKVLVRGQDYMNWRQEDEASQRMVIVQLYNSGLATQEKLSEIFEVHINSVRNYINAYEREGIVGLVNRPSGPKDAWKINPEMKFKILEIAIRNRDITYEEMSKVIKEKWNENISINSVRQVLLENGFIKERIRDDDSWQQEDLFKKMSDEQMELTYSGSTDEQMPSILLDKEKEVYSDSKTKNRSCYSPAQRAYLEQLKQGLYSAYAGGLLFAPLLRRYSFLTTIKKVIDIEIQEGYSLEELSLTLFYFDLFRFETMENFKTVYPEEFGVIVSRQMSPSVFTLRRFLHKVRELKRGEELIEEFAKEYLKKGLTRWGVMYIDGHFLPYYGMYPISKGWHSVRKIPMKGSYNFLAVDEKFSPFLFLIRSSSEDLLQKIPEIIMKARRLAEQAGISKDDIKNLTVIFDREGYSAELFKILDGEEDNDEKLKVRFISWAKYSDKWVDEIGDDKFNKTVTVTYEIQEPEDVKYFETERVMKKYGKLFSRI